MTIQEYINQFGSIEKAAHALGVTFGTLYRWRSGKKPKSGLYAELLKSKGISL